MPVKIARVLRAFALLSTVFGLLAGCATTMRTDLVERYQSTECVVLLHGLNRSWRAMDRFAETLQQEGFSTANVDYPSSTEPIEVLAPMVVGEGLNKCRQTGAKL